MRSVRLKLHYNYLANFDFIDKKLQIKENLAAIPKLNTLIVRSKSDKPDSEKHTVLQALVLESFGNQKSLMTKTDKVFSKKLFFKITLRKESLFLFLDFCLNTIFLNEHKHWAWGNVQVSDKLHFYLSNNILNNFNILSVQLEYFLQLPDFFTLVNKTSKDKAFYLIPMNEVNS
uniref:Ribosomal protein L5 n=1 Tax=Grateloupia filicina TaxID=31455 RepID=A0A343WS94_9FLOR|nr:hypothetical protein [Grateloupia filicina]AWD77501.1 hypothetical protein [Grateloupia filicina]